jgi:hypothetical protein
MIIYKPIESHEFLKFWVNINICSTKFDVFPEKAESSVKQAKLGHLPSCWYVCYNLDTYITLCNICI